MMKVHMTNYKLSVGLAVTASLAMTGLLFAGEPSGIGEKGTGQTKKSTERQQSGKQPDMSQVPEELREGKSAQAAREQELGAIEREGTNRIGGQEPAGIGEKGTGQTKKSTERQQSGKQPDMSQVPEELKEGKSARAAEELSHEKKN
jgi:hypothetical protein